MRVNLDGIHTNLRFSAAHMVIGHESCGKIHGHSYIVDVEVDGERNGQFGFVIDFISSISAFIYLRAYVVILLQTGYFVTQHPKSCLP